MQFHQINKSNFQWSKSTFYTRITRWKGCYQTRTKKRFTQTLWAFFNDNFIFQKYWLCFIITKSQNDIVNAIFFDWLRLLCPIKMVSEILFKEICTNNFYWCNLLPDGFLKKWKFLPEKLGELQQIHLQVIYLILSIAVNTNSSYTVFW